MIRKYRYGTPFDTEALTEKIETAEEAFPYGEISQKDGFAFTYIMDEDDIVYGLGESNRGINKRGYVYESNCSDQPNHTEDKISLYGAHNFIVISGKQTFGLFVDYPGKLKFDIGYTLSSQLKITCEDADLYLYVIEGETPYDIVKQFRKIIGRSYIPPKFAFGFGQSRWGYTTADDFRKAADGYRENNIPIDMVYMDIDYMEDYKDFTVNQENFPDFEAYVNEMKEKGIHLVPIIDAGVKVEAGYDVYEEGVEKNYFCKREDGSDFVSAVWPGWTHFPDVLNADARAWFGQKYERLISKGIDGFWNDMNEPAMFCTPEGVAELKEYIKDNFMDKEETSGFVLGAKVEGLANGQTFLMVSDKYSRYRKLPVSVYTTDKLQLSHETFDLITLLGYSKTLKANVVLGNGGYEVMSDNPAVSVSVNEAGEISMKATSKKEDFTANITVTDCTGLTANIVVTVKASLEPFTTEELEAIKADNSRRYYYRRTDDYDVEYVNTTIDDGKIRYGWNLWGSYYHYMDFMGDKTEGVKEGATFSVSSWIVSDKYSGQAVTLKIIKNDGTNLWGVFSFVDEEREILCSGYFCDTVDPE